MTDDPIAFHDLRATFGTRAAQAFPLSDVKAMMGHADISTTMIYVHHVPRRTPLRGSRRCSNLQSRLQAPRE